MRFVFAKSSLDSWPASSTRIDGHSYEWELVFTRFCTAATAGGYAQQAGHMLEQLGSAIGLGGGSEGGSAMRGGFALGSGPVITEQRPREDREPMLSDLSDAERQAVLQMRAAVRAPSQGCWNQSDTTAAAISVAVNNGVLVTVGLPS